MQIPRVCFLSVPSFAAVAVFWAARCRGRRLAAVARADARRRVEGNGPVEKFAADQITLRWRVPIGSGYSGPTVADGRVYVTDRQTDPKPVERVLCFDAKTGRNLWTYSYDCPYRDVGYPAGPRASVSLDEGRAYALGTMGHLHCLDAAGQGPLAAATCSRTTRPACRSGALPPRRWSTASW